MPVPVYESLDEVDPELFTHDIGVLATNGPDGRPQQTAVWFVRDGNRILVSATAGRRKTRNLERDPRCSMFFHHPDSSYYCLEVRGEATITPDPDYTGSDVIGARYDADFRTFDAPGVLRVILTIEPRRVVVTDERD